jgi:hypothetical protein
VLHYSCTSSIYSSSRGYPTRKRRHSMVIPNKSNFVIDVARVVAIAATTCGLLCHWQTTTSLSCRHRPSNNNSESVPRSQVARPCIISGGTTGCTHVHRHNNNNNLLLLRQLVQCYPFLSSLTPKRTNSNYEASKRFPCSNNPNIATFFDMKLASQRNISRRLFASL